MHNVPAFSLFFFNDTATTEIYTLSLHDALPIWCKLHREWLRNIRRRRGNDDAVERRRLRPPRRAIPHARLDVREAEAPEPLFRLHEEIGEPLDREDFAVAGEVRQNRGLVSGPGADLENPAGASRLQLLGHEGHDVGLRDRLPAADGKWTVVVRVAREMWRQEPLAGRPAHRRQHPLIPHAASRELPDDHARAPAARVCGGMC